MWRISCPCLRHTGRQTPRSTFHRRVARQLSLEALEPRHLLSFAAQPAWPPTRPELRWHRPARRFQWGKWQQR